MLPKLREKNLFYDCKYVFLVVVMLSFLSSNVTTVIRPNLTLCNIQTWQLVVITIE